MKRILYFCGMMLLCVNMMAQIDLEDQNWKCSLNEDFTTPGRYWIDSSFLSSDSVWKAYSSGLTHGNNKMIYQYSQCHFNDTEGYMELVAEYDSTGRISAHDYDLPYTVHHYPTYDDLHYFSGRIDHFDKHGTDSAKFRYGYFEIRCKLPIHRDAFPAFWLWDEKNASQSNDPHYEEIDIFEFSWNIGESPNWIGNPNPHGLPDPYTFTTGIYFNDHGTEYVSYARNFPSLPYWGSDLSNWHIFACEWMPGYVKWYCDGTLVNEYSISENIPHRYLTLKTNYAIDGKYKYNHTMWMDNDDMIVDYIIVYQLLWDCDSEETIYNQLDLDNFGYAVKKAISITPSSTNIEVNANDKMTFRVSDGFEITKLFQIDTGAEFTIIRQDCPN